MMIMKMLKKTLTLTIIFINILPSSGQIIRSLDFNHAVMEASEKKNVLTEKAISSDTIFFEDEFFEDFSSYHYEVFPKTEVWADQYACINSTYADSMISLGVATLDAYDQKGYPYYSSLKTITHGDTLTSQMFIFNDPSTDSLVFSFFYQCGGKVSGPEINDSLILDFFDANDSLWCKAFYLLGGEQMHAFKQVIIPIEDSLIQDGFRFRFRNYVSLALENIPGEDYGKYSNADQWHLDYIQIKSVKDTAELKLINDMTIVKPLMSSLVGYTSVPYHHYALAANVIERKTMPISYRTIFPMQEEIISLVRYYSSYDILKNKQLRDLQYDENIAPYAYFNEAEFFTSGYTYDKNDSIAEIELMAVIQAQAIDQKLVNDTAKRKEIYHDHYAYDDGTAELGLGIAGEYQNLNRIAVLFRVYKQSNDPDNLEAILIYFNKSINDYTSQSEYKISIRKNDGIYPASDTLYTSKGYFPDYSVRLNEFTRIELNRPVSLSDTFFIVIEQLDSYLNIGYDINNDSRDKIFFYTNTGQGWQNSVSLPAGSLMIRPSFGKYTLPHTGTKIIDKSDNLKIYPNPAKDILYLDLPEEYINSYTIKIYNIMGVMLVNSCSERNSIDISGLDKGLYLLQLTSEDKKMNLTTKFIKE